MEPNVSAMFLLGFLLVVTVSAKVNRTVVNDYVVEINNGVLTRVLPTNRSLGILELEGLPFTRVDDNCFKDATGLRSLTFTNFKIKMVQQPLTFRFLPNLEYLALKNSTLWDLRYVFWGLSNLRILNLTDSFVRAKPGIFFGLSNETLIVLRGSNIQTVEPRYFLEPHPIVRICMINGIVQWIDLLQKEMNANESCDMTYTPMYNSWLYLNKMGIQGFEKGWFNISKVAVRRLYLVQNDITHLTSELLNEIPDGLEQLDLSWNKIKSVKEGVINNTHLYFLNLDGNPIEEIDFSAFKNKNLEHVRLTLNSTSIIPRTMKKIYISAYNASKAPKIVYCPFRITVKSTKSMAKTCEGYRG